MTAPAGCVAIPTVTAAGGVAVEVNVTEPTPVAVAESVFVPTAPSVHEPTVAMPDAFVVCDAPLTLPPPDPTANVTLTPGDGWPVVVVTSTEGGTATLVPAGAVCPSPVLTLMVDAGDAVPVAANVTGARPATVAVTELTPAAAPSVHDPTEAIPNELVIAAAPVTDPEPETTAKVTMIPGVTLPAESVTVTVGATAVAVPATAFCASPADFTTVAGRPGTTAMSADADVPPESEAMTCAVPIARARTIPCGVTLMTLGLSELNVAA